MKEVLEEVEKRVDYVFDSNVKLYNDDFNLVCFENITEKELTITNVLLIDNDNKKLNKIAK